LAVVGRRKHLTGLKRISERLDRPSSHTARGELLFLAPGDVTKGRVEPISWMRTCEAYALAGLDVTLVTLRMRRPDAVPDHELWSHYGIDRLFTIRTAPTLLESNAPTWQFRVSAGSVATALALLTLPRVAASSARRLVAHARAPVLLAPFVALSRALPVSRRPLLVLETHSLPTSANGWIVRSADLVVVNSEKLAADIQAACRLDAGRVLHAPLPPFNPVRPHPKHLVRERLSIDADAAVACYTGKMTQEHNDFLLLAAERAARKIDRFRMLLVGGNPEILEWTRRRARELEISDSIILTGFVAPATVELYQSAADVLVYHMPTSMGIFSYTTPAKCYEYQAAERPIVATDFPLFQEVFGEDGERAMRVTDRTPAGLAEGIVRVVSLPDSGHAMTVRGAAFVRDRTWAARTEAILQALGV